MKIILALSLLLISFTQIFAFNLVDNNKANAVIVLGKDATAPEITAASEVVNYINKISGVTLEIVSTPSQTTNNIFVGQTNLTKKILGSTFDWKKLKDDGIVIKSGKNYLVLAGDRPRGTLYAVYTFLEDNLGCRFWSDDSEFIPNNKTISINNLNTIYTPPFLSREAYFKNNNLHVNFSVKMKLNGHFNKIPNELGGNIELLGWCHTFNTLIPAQKYGKEHPEWFAERSGKRDITGNSQLCLSNKEMVKELTENVMSRIAENPNTKLISVAQLDNQGYCTCDACKKLTEKYGHSGALLTVVNSVAKEVKKQYPDILVETLAYQYTREAPKNIKPDDNVIIRLCTIECNFAEPLDQPSNAKFYKDLTDWKKVAKNLYIWDYVVNFCNFHIIHPNFQSLQRNVQIFANNNVKAVFEQGDTANSNLALSHLKSWILAKLLWNPNIDYDKTIREYLNGYYGAAGEDMYKFLDINTKAVERDKTELICYMNDNPYLKADDMIAAFTALNSGLKKVENDPVLKDRVLCELYSYQVCWLIAPKEIQDAVTNSGVLEYTSTLDFINMYNKFSKAHENAHFREGRSIDDSILSGTDNLKKEGNIPELCKNLPSDSWVDIQETGFTFAMGDDYSKIVDDSNASNGKAVFMSSFHTVWSAQRMLSSLYLDKTYDYGDFYAVYRVEPNKKTGVAYGIGIYNESAKEIFNFNINSNDTPDNKYVTKYIGRLPYKTTSNLSYLYVCPMGDSDLANGLYLDRVFVIQGKE